MDRIGRYEILQELGRGAMGAVYKARDPQIGRTVAIKIILTAGLAAEELAQYKQRFYREAQTAGQVNHPGIVTIHDIAEDEDGQPYLVMEFVDGVTLHRMLRPAHSGHLPERLPLEQALDIAAQVAEALDFAHGRGVVHRDIKPGNILITPEGRCKIADFGIAKFTDAEATRTTTVLGTPAYMAPEQLRGGTVDARSDVFSLGAMLYWILTGQKPFPGEDLTSVSFKVVYTDPAPPSEIDPHLPRDLDTVVSRCIAKNPHDRYASAKELATDLHAVRSGSPIAATAAPRAVGGEPTVSTIQIGGGVAPPLAMPVTTRAAEVTTASPSRARRAPRTGPAVTAGVLLTLALGLVAYQLWPQERIVFLPAPEGSEKAGQAGKTSPRGAASQPGQQAGAASSAAAGAPTAPPLVAASTLEVECNFSFNQAKLEIFLGARKLVDTKLEGKARVFRSRGGTYKNSFQLATGSHKFRVRVISEDPKEPFDQQAAIDGDFAAGATRRLTIEFPKKQLTLRWK